MEMEANVVDDYEHEFVLPPRQPEPRRRHTS